MTQVCVNDSVGLPYSNDWFGNKFIIHSVESAMKAARLFSLTGMCMLLMTVTMVVQAQQRARLTIAASALDAGANESPTGYLMTNSLRSTPNGEMPPTIEVVLPGFPAAVTLSRTLVVNSATQIVRMTSEGAIPFRKEAVVYGGMLNGQPIVARLEGDAVLVSHSSAGVVETYSSSTAGMAVKSTRTQTSRRPFRCGNDEADIPPSVREAVSRSMKAAERPQEKDAEVYNMNLAVEIDHRLYQFLGSSADSVTNYVIDLLSRISSIYTRDVGVRFTVTYLRIWEEPNDPYDDSTSVFDLIEPFASTYQSTMDSVNRDIAVLLIRRSGEGGIARSIGGICEPGLSYCAADVSRSTKDSLDISDYTLVAHEIGHVCGGIHTQNCLWPGGPLDSCVTSEMGSCVGAELVRPSVGTIMSYCSQSSTAIQEFHPLHKSMLRRYLRDASCIGNRPEAGVAIVRGVVTSANDGKPVEGVPLVIRPANDGNLIVGTPAIAGDTIVTSDPQGRYQFTGLSYGVYSISALEGYKITPIEFSAPDQGLLCLVPKDSVEVNFSIGRGRLVRFRIQPGSQPRSVTIAAGSKSIKGYGTSLTIPAEEIATGNPILRTLLYGDYSIVPMGTGQTFDPPTMTVSVNENQTDTQEVSFRCVDAADTMYTSAYFAVVSNDDGTVEKAGNESILIRDALVGTSYTTRTDENGAAAQLLPATGIYFTRGQWDSTQWVDDRDPEVVLGVQDLRPVVLSKRLRVFPVWAKTLKFSHNQRVYEPLGAQAKPLPIPSGMQGVTLELPFPFQTASGSSSTVLVSKSPVVCIGMSPGLLSNPSVLQRARSLAIVSAFERATVESNDDGEILWDVRGTAPNRVAIIEWRNARGSSIDSVTYQQVRVGAVDAQIWLYENGTVEVVFGRIRDFQGKEIEVLAGLRGRDIMDASIAYPTSEGWGAPAVITTGLQQEDVLVSVPLQTTEDSAPAAGMTLTWSPQPVSVDVNDGMASSLKVSPLPATSELLISGLMDGAPSKITILDVVGNVVSMSSAKGSSVALDVAALAPGLYFVIATHGSTSQQAIAVIGTR
jgi:hypothetical protein